MRYLQYVLFATVAVIGFASIASAADMPVKGPAYAPAPALFDWTGFYIGGQIGGGFFGYADETYPLSTSIAGANAGLPLRGNQNYWINGPAAGGVIGAAYQFGRTVIGIEGEFNWANINGTSDIVNFAGNDGDTFITRIDSYGTVVGKFGYAFGSLNQTLLYVTGGGAMARVTDQYNFFNTPNSAPNGTAETIHSLTHTEAGWTVGAGVEYALYWGPMPTGWTVKADYKYVSLPGGSIQYNAALNNKSTWTENPSIFQFGVNYRFNWSAPVTARY
jgi:outer membrane immunogenic protein